MKNEKHEKNIYIYKNKKNEIHEKTKNNKT